MISLTRVVLWFSVLALLAASLMAQAPGTLQGQVLDQSGGSGPQASVIVTGPNNVTKVVETNTDGIYTVPGLPAGKYTVRVTAPGFTLFENTAVDVAAG